MMIRKRKNDSGVDDKQRKPHSRQKAESDACELQDRITDLKNVSQEQLADATFMLFMVAKQQTEQPVMRLTSTRRFSSHSIRRRTEI
jgi:hypothetical protein